jgi:hypothetical protein
LNQRDVCKYEVEAGNIAENIAEMHASDDISQGAMPLEVFT